MARSRHQSQPTQTEHQPIQKFCPRALAKLLDALSIAVPLLLFIGTFRALEGTLAMSGTAGTLLGVWGIAAFAWLLLGIPIMEWLFKRSPGKLLINHFTPYKIVVEHSGAGSLVGLLQTLAKYYFYFAFTMMGFWAGILLFVGFTQDWGFTGFILGTAIASITLAVGLMRVRGWLSFSWWYLYFVSPFFWPLWEYYRWKETGETAVEGWNKYWKNTDHSWKVDENTARIPLDEALPFPYLWLFPFLQGEYWEVNALKTRVYGPGEALTEPTEEESTEEEPTEEEPPEETDRETLHERMKQLPDQQDASFPPASELPAPQSTSATTHTSLSSR